MWIDIKLLGMFVAAISSRWVNIRPNEWKLR